MVLEEIALIETNDQVITQTAFSPDGRWLATASGGPAEVRLWTVPDWNDSGWVLRKGRHIGLGPIAFTPDVKTLAIGGANIHIELWGVEDKRLQRRIGNTISGGSIIRSLQIDPSGRMILASEAGLARIWDVESGERLGFFGRVKGFGISPDWHSYFTGSRDSIRMHDLATNEIVRALPTGKPTNVLAVNRDGTRVAFDDRQIEYDIYDYGEIKSFDPQEDALKLWNLLSDDVTAIKLDSPTAEIHDAAFSPNNQYLVGWSWYDGPLRILDTVNGKLTQILNPKNDARAIALSPDGKFLVCGGSNARKGSIQVWKTSW